MSASVLTLATHPSPEWRSLRVYGLRFAAGDGLVVLRRRLAALECGGGGGGGWGAPGRYGNKFFAKDETFIEEPSDSSTLGLFLHDNTATPSVVEDSSRIAASSLFGNWLVKSLLIRPTPSPACAHDSCSRRHPLLHLHPGSPYAAYAAIPDRGLALLCSLPDSRATGP